MKLRAKLTLNFITVVLITIVVSFFLINRNVQNEFNHFIQLKNQQWLEEHKPGNLNKPPLANSRVPNQPNQNPPIDNPFDLTPQGPPGSNKQTLEQHFLQNMNNSFLWAGGIDLVFAIILAILLSNFLLRRIYRLKSSMTQYMKDGSGKAVAHDSNDEVDELANIYNALIEKIQNEEKIRKDFFIDMSHELRTPLTSIKGYLEGLLDKVFDPEKEKDIHQKTLHETDRMIHLIKEMTTLAKLETEKSALTLEETDLHALTEEVAEMISPQLEERGLKLKISGKADAEIDQYKFKQVIINLVDNAQQYAKKNSTIKIEIGKNGAAAFWRIKNQIEDPAPKNIDHFFERFYRGDKSRTYDSKKPHLGIGLNIVKKIIDQHKGKISAKMEGDEIVFEINL